MPESGWPGLAGWGGWRWERQWEYLQVLDRRTGWIVLKKVKLGRVVCGGCCPRRQLSCCVSCSVLWTQRRQGASWEAAGRLRSRRNCGGVSSLLAAQQPRQQARSRPSHRGWAGGHSHEQQERHCSLGELVRAFGTERPRWTGPWDTHAPCVTSAVTRSLFTERGARPRGCGAGEHAHATLADLLFPYKLGPAFNRVGITGTILDMLYLKCLKHPNQEITGQLNTHRSSILRRDVVVAVV